MTRSGSMFGAMITLLAASGCGKDKGKTEGEGGGAATRGTGLAIDAAAVNSLVPEPLKATLVFEKQDIVLEQGRTPTTYTLAAPKGWSRTSKMFGNFEPASGTGLGFGTKLKVGANCGGECKPKDWGPVVDEYASSLLKGTVLKDEKSPGRRIVVAETSGGGLSTTEVLVAWWTEGAKETHYCHVTLGDTGKAAAPAFEKACQAVAVSGGD